jgi:hypothetical protein
MQRDLPIKLYFQAFDDASISSLRHEHDSERAAATFGQSCVTICNKKLAA